MRYIRAWIHMFGLLVGCGKETMLVWDDAGSNVCEKDGEKRCVADNVHVEEVCIIGDAGPDGKGSWEAKSCASGQECLDGGCGVCPAVCDAGAMNCSEDSKNVIVCDQAPPSDCFGWVPLLNCRDAGMASCLFPPAPSPNDPIQYCVNDCGGRGVPLVGTLCDVDPAHPGCGLLVCDEQTKQLVSDHVACLSGGLPCNANEECSSCLCSNQVCIGSAPSDCSNQCM